MQLWRLFPVFLVFTVGTVSPATTSYEVQQVLRVVWKSLVAFYQEKYPSSNPPSRFFKSLYDIQSRISRELGMTNPRSLYTSPAKRRKQIEKYLYAAIHGGDIDFTKSMLGKALFLFIKDKLRKGFQLPEIDQAAKSYLISIEKKIGTNTFDKVVARKGDVTLMFTIDTTGSMSDEIAAAKAIVKSIIRERRGFDVDYLLSPFNDPVVGPVVHKSSSEKLDFIKAIGALNATGGGDCPEMAFGGMLAALNAGPKYESPMYVFTDASAKDKTPDNVLALDIAANTAATSINFFTKIFGCGKGINQYNDVAAYTSGQVFSLADSRELKKLDILVKNNLLGSNIIASGGNKNNKRGKRRVRRADSQSIQYTIPVDETIDKILVSVTVGIPRRAKYVQLINPLGHEKEANVTLAKARFYEISKPEPGFWIITFPRAVGKHDFIVRSMAEDPIDFGYLFYLKPKDGPPLIPVEHPLAGAVNHIIVTMTGVSHVIPSSVTLDFLTVHNKKILSGVKLNGTKDSNMFQTNFIAFRKPFKFRLGGITTKGYMFERLGKQVVTPKEVLIRPIYAEKDFTAKLKGKRTLIFEVLNTGLPRPFLLAAKARYGRVVIAFPKRVIFRRSYFSLKYTAPTAEKMKNKTDKVIIYADALSKRARFSAELKVLLL